MGRGVLIAGLLFATVLLLSGCASNDNQYSPSKAEELALNLPQANASEPNASISQVELTLEETNATLVHRYNTLIDNYFYTGSKNLKITIKGFDRTYEKKQDVDKAHVLLLIENVGKKADSVYCSDLEILDDKEREFILSREFDIYFGKNSESGGVQPGLAHFMECSQIFPKNANLQYLAMGDLFLKPVIVANLSTND